MRRREKRSHRGRRAPFCGHLKVPSGAGAAGRQHTGPAAGRPPRGVHSDTEAAIAGGGGRREARAGAGGAGPAGGTQEVRVRLHI